MAAFCSIGAKPASSGFSCPGDQDKRNSAFIECHGFQQNKTLALALTVAIVSLAAARADTIKVGVQPWLGYGPLWVAEEKGFFKKHDLDVVLTTFNWDQDMTAALASENLNVIAAGSNSVITNVNQGVHQKGFLVIDLSFDAGATSNLLLNYALKQNGMKLRALFVLIESERRSNLLMFKHNLIDPRFTPVGLCSSDV